MPTPSQKKYRLVLACLVLAGASAVTLAALRSPANGDADTAAQSGVYVQEMDGFRYEYHAPTGHEGLYDIARDPHTLVNVLQGHEDVALRCRRTLESKLHVDNLDCLRARYGDTIRRLQALGYL